MEIGSQLVKFVGGARFQPKSQMRRLDSTQVDGGVKVGGGICVGLEP